MKPLSFGMRLTPRAAAAGLAVIIATAGLAGAADPAAAWADSTTPPHEAVTALADDGDDAVLTIVAGRAVREGNVYRFPDLKITSNTDKNIRSITVQFTTAITSGDDVQFDTVDGFVVTGKTANRSVNASNAAEEDGGWPAEKWEEYLQQHMRVTLAGGSGTKGLRMIASLTPVTDIYDYNSENGHYYRYVNKPSTWTEARDAAAAAEPYMGMKGYLVTVTSAKESSFITTLIDTNMWMGGTAEPTLGAVANTGFTWQKPAAGWPYSFYWVTGPEATMGPGGTPMEICRMIGSGNAQTVKDPVTGGNAYFNFASGEPNNAKNIGTYDNAGAQPSGEYCLHMYSQKNSAGEATAAGNIGKWNDYPNYPKSGAHQKCCYVIEYGGLEDDMEDPDNPGNDGDADVDVNVDVYVKVDINVDPEERTITTEADSINLGQTLKVSENINGGVLDPTSDQVTRTYTLVDANGNDILDENGQPITVPESEVPYRAGRYKVTSTKPNADDGTEFVAGTATFTVRPATVDPTRETTADGTTQPKVYEKVYDGTPDFSLGNVALPGVLPAHASDVKIAADSAAYVTSEVGDTKVVLQGARLETADGNATSNYTLAGVKEDGSLELAARIVPRELVVNASATVRWGLEGKPLNDEAGAPIVFASDEDVHDSATAAWTANMLAPRDAQRIEGGIASILGEATLTCTRDSDGAALDVQNPQAGTYTVAVHFSEVNPLGTAAKAARALAAQAGDASFDAPITNVKDLGGGRYDIGNYLLTLKSTKVVVTADPAGDDALGEIGDLIEGGTIEEEVTPGKPPISKDDLDDIVKDQIGGKVPDTDPVITIIKDGEEVDSIDPTVPGHYVVIATYPDPDGGEDKVVRFEYVVSEPKPDDPGTPEEPGTPGNPDGTQPPAGDVVVDETVTRPVDPNGKPITKDDIDKEIKTEWPDKVPADVKPEITITLNGEEVDFIDPTRPGTYYVTAVYHDPNGGPDRIVRLTYVVEGADEEGTSVTTSRHRLAQTGDEAPVGAALIGLAGGAAALAIARRRCRG